MPDDIKRSWDVLVIGGPSGSGKTSVSYPLARRYGVAICEIDDLCLTAKAMTTPEQQPALHYWDTHPDAAELPPEKIIEHFVELCRALAPAVSAVIDNHLETNMPVVLDGDYALPEFFADASERVRPVFIYEPDEDVILGNLKRREPTWTDCEKRAQVGRLFGQWLKEECERMGLPAVQARPWDTVIDRVADAAA
jgi:2-phosphoglycerate kinase